MSEFRFVYWDADAYLYYVVKRGHNSYRHKWAVQDGGFISWDGTRWDENLRGTDAYRWDLHEALNVAEKLAREMNMVLVHRLEKRSPGEFKGSRHDMAVCPAPVDSHVYLSTGCLHGKHDYCGSAAGRSDSGVTWEKVPGRCKWCVSYCQCVCHGGGELDAGDPETV